MSVTNQTAVAVNHVPENSLQVVQFIGANIEDLYKKEIEKTERLKAIVKQRDETIDQLNLKIDELLAANVNKSLEERYEVKDILKVRYRKNGLREFLIRWKNYSPNSDTWEPESNLSCPDLLEQFSKKSGKTEFPDLEENDDDSYSDASKNDSKDYEDYVNQNHQLAAATTGMERRSSRVPKPTQTLNYNHQPSCCVCTTTLLDIPGVSGLLCCSVNCKEIYEANHQ